MDAKTGYTSNQIPLSVFFRKPGGSMDWSLASNKSIFSLHTGNVSLSREHGIIGLAAALKLDETHKSEDGEIKGEEHKILVASGKQDEENEEEEVEDDGEKIIKPEESNETVNQRSETNTVLSLPLVNQSQYADESDNEDDERKIEEMIKLNCKEHDMSDVTGKHKDKETVEDDVMEIILDDSSICCRSDTSNNSISSFTFPTLQNEDESVKTPSMELRLNVFDKWFELSQLQTQTQTQPQPHPHPQFYFIPASRTTLTQLPPQRKSSSSRQATEVQSQKAFRNRWLSCFLFPFQRD